MAQPKTLNIYNLKYFFNYRTVPTRGIQPGMIVEFNYRSPNGVHDVKPLIYVLEVEGDRVWGMNLHYNLALLGEIVKLKQGEVASFVNKQQEKQKAEVVVKPQDYKPDPKQLNQKNIPSLPENKEILKERQKKQPLEVKPNSIRYDQKLLESYTLTKRPENILRNYLYARMSTVNKLIFKPA
jgi:hypothetical protein